jgi:predicted ArsR family transcriptional regulator
MSAAVSTEAASPDELLAAAEDAERQVRELRGLASQITNEADRIAAVAVAARTERDRLLRPPLEWVHPLVMGQPRLDLKTASKLVRCIEQLGPSKVSTIAEHTGIEIDRARRQLGKLRERGIVELSGMKRGAIWMLPGQGEALPADRSNYRHLIRDAAQKLDTFTRPEIEAELPQLANATIRRHLNELVDDGVLERERVGKPFLYSFVKAEGPTPARPRQATPESLVIDRRFRGSVTTGRRLRRSGREVRDTIRQVESQGAQIREAKHGYLVVKPDGTVADSVPKTTSDWRGMKNLRATLKRHGYDVP